MEQDTTATVSKDNLNKLNKIKYEEKHSNLDAVITRLLFYYDKNKKDKAE